ncbi:MqnA/MqnD/SBP family protein [Rhodothermus profundi]|uniref:Predicted solute-binding protein n=1 Tax=Rhodothermus profundi TaxID=633813 RepID=A0A1M6PMJ6_9BACT|nr:MqnA/MqnD/SBP family protein [Rhodothermus profundi]SHK09176.1 Predicted solute-binding protein [Rhodothermus profundi]
MVRLAIWDTLPAEFFVSGLTAGTVQLPVPLEVERCAAPEALERLLGGDVDVALVPTLDVLLHNEEVDALPAVALSSWKHPYARIVLRQGFTQVGSLALDPRYAQEAFVAQVVLQEHYGQTPQPVAYEGATRDELLSGDEDACLLIGNDVPTLQTGTLTLDLGQEWYELANYPMVWGLFAVRKGEGNPVLVKTLRRLARAAEAQREVWTHTREMSPELHAYFLENLRLRFDDLVMASLTEFREYLFYFQITDEVPDLPLYTIPEDEEDEEEDEDEVPLL